jgi:hypothetical protein
MMAGFLVSLDPVTFLYFFLKSHASFRGISRDLLSKEHDLGSLLPQRCLFQPKLREKI